MYESLYCQYQNLGDWSCIHSLEYFLPSTLCNNLQWCSSSIGNNCSIFVHKEIHSELNCGEGNLCSVAINLLFTPPHTLMPCCLPVPIEMTLSLYTVLRWGRSAATALGTILRSHSLTSGLRTTHALPHTLGERWKARECSPQSTERVTQGTLLPFPATASLCPALATSPPLDAAGVSPAPARSLSSPTRPALPSSLSAEKQVADHAGPIGNSERHSTSRVSSQRHRTVPN